MTTSFAVRDDAWERAGRPMPAAVLWDLDGTLVDTEPYWFETERAIVAEHGKTWSDDQAKHLVGSDLLDSARYLKRYAGMDLPPERIVDFLVSRVTERVREHVEWRPGAVRLLTELRDRGIPCALVTMSHRPIADTVVGALPPDRFAAVVTGDQVTHGKPHPEPYLRAAALLGSAPRDCLAIEDSPTGVASAEAAGAPVLAVEHLVPIPEGPGRLVSTGLGETTVDDLARIAFSLRDR
jgi:HAD superfamily hydrolase (TIGR01509 family)